MAKKTPEPIQTPATIDDLIAGGYSYQPFSTEQLQPQPTAEQLATQQEEEDGWRGTISNSAASLLRGAIAVPEAAVGLADMVTGGHAGKAAEEYLGFRPEEAKQIVSEMLNTKERNAQLQQFQQAEGFMGKAATALSNPSMIGHAVLESLPAMGAGGVVGRGVMAMAPRAGAALSAGIGEGVVGGGSAAEHIRQQTSDGLMTAGQVGMAAVSGVATTALGALGGKIAQKLGVKDVDTMLVAASQSAATRGSLVKEVLKGALAEGILEELPQSVAEQVAQNIALGKPLEEGIDEAAVLGTLSGMAMGGAAQMLPGQGPLTRAANAGINSGAIVPGMPGVPPSTPPGAPPSAPGAPPAPQAGPNMGGSAAQGAAPAMPPAPAAAPVSPPSPQSPLAAAMGAPATPVAPPAGTSAPGAPFPPADPAEPFAGSPLAPAPSLDATQPMVARPEVVDPFAAPDVDPTAAAPTGETAKPAREKRKKPQSSSGAIDQREADQAWVDSMNATVEQAVQPGDIKNKQGTPFKTMGAAMSALTRLGGEEKGEIVAVKDGLVIRPKGATSADVDRGGDRVPAVSGTAGSDSAAGADGAGGLGADGRTAGDGQPSAVAGGTVAAGGANPPVAGPGVLPAGALNEPKQPAAAPAAESAKPPAAPGEGAAGAGRVPGSAAPGATDLQAPRVDDDLYGQAEALVKEHQRPSISLVQRHLRIGYNRAAGLLEQMERNGLVSPMKTDGSRTMVGGSKAAGTTPAAEGEKSKWLSALANQNRIQGDTAAKIRGVVNGRADFVGDPRATKEGRALLATYEEAVKAGATTEEIARAITAESGTAAAAPAPASQPETEAAVAAPKGVREKRKTKATGTALAKPQTLFVEREGKRFEVASIAEAQAKWEEFLAQSGAGVSKVGNGVRVVDQDGAFVARISYNGRVWDSEDDGSGAGKVVAESPSTVRNINAEATEVGPPALEANGREAAPDTDPTPPKGGKKGVREKRAATKEAKAAPGTASWQSNPKAKVYDLVRDGEILAQIRHAGHPTALRPYYFTGGTDIARVHPEIGTRKFSTLAEAKKWADEIAAGELPLHATGLTLFPTVEQLQEDLRNLDEHILERAPAKFSKTGDLKGALASPRTPKGVQIVRSAIVRRIDQLGGTVAEVKPAAAPSPSRVTSAEDLQALTGQPVGGFAHLHPALVGLAADFTNRILEEYEEDGLTFAEVPTAKGTGGEKAGHRLVMALAKELNDYGNFLAAHANGKGDANRSATARKNIVGKLGFRAENVLEPLPAEATREVTQYQPGSEPKVANATALPPAATMEDTLVLVACGGAKRNVRRPLWDLYTGPMWQTVRTKLGSAIESAENLFVLSGRHGIQNARNSFEPYEQLLTDSTADSLVRTGLGTSTVLNQDPPWKLLQRPDGKPWANVVIAGGEDYRRVMSVYVAQAQQLGLIDGKAAVVATEGGIGEQRSQLGGWLEQLAPAAAAAPAQAEQEESLSIADAVPAETADDRTNSLGSERVSPRMPTAVKATEPTMDPVRLQPDLATAQRDAAAFEHNINLIAQYPNFQGLKGTVAQKAERIIQHAVDNLLWLHDHWKPNHRNRSRMWYVGGNRIAHRWAKRFGISPQHVAGVIAATSPQKDWFQNVSLAERILEAVINQSGVAWDAEMSALVRARDWGKKEVPDPSVYEGKSLRDLYGAGTPGALLDMAIWIRAWDEAKNTQMARVITPEGGFSKEFDKGKTGKPVALRWQSFPTIVKTLQVLQTKTAADISVVIGANHKVRSFYNNIIAPYAGDDVTIDTHAVAAALLRPLGSSSVEVAHNFGSGELGSVGPKNSAITGLYGTYAIYAEAYRRAAKQRDILPREMQSITWEAVRGLFRPEQKNEKIRGLADQLWSAAATGEIDASKARKSVAELVGGIAEPAWVGSDSGTHASTGDSSYAGGVPQAGGDVGAADGRGGVGAPAAVQQGEPAGVALSVADAPADAQDGESNEPSAADVSRVSRLAERLAKLYPGRVFHAAASPAGRGGRAGGTAGAAAWVAKRLFGHDIVWVRFDGRPLFNGAFSTAVADAIFLNADSDKPHLAVLGHELLHRLRKERPDLYAQLQGQLSRALKDVDTFRDALEAKYKDQGYSLPANWMEELHADIVGDFFLEPEFWGALKQGKPTLFQRVANAVLKFLDDIKASLTGSGKRPLGTDAFIADLDAAREAVVTAMRGFSTSQTAGGTDGVNLSIAERQAQTDTPAFKRWFNGSKVVDKTGAPLTLYHGTTADFGSFDPARSNSNTKTGVPQGAFVFSSSPDVASSYAGQKTEDVGLPTPALEEQYRALIAQGQMAEAIGLLRAHGVNDLKTYREGGNVKPVYLSAKKVLKVNAKGENWRTVYYKDEEWSTNDLMELAKSNGYDALQVKNVHDRQEGRGGNGDTWVVFEPTQIKSAIGNNGDFDPENPDVSLSIATSLNSVRDARLPAGYIVNDLITNSGTLSWWRKTVGTPADLAERSPQFKRVYDAVQRFLGDVSHFAARSADMAPNILPKLDKLRDIWRKPLSAENKKAISAPIFEGTLTWARDAQGRAVTVESLEQAAAQLDVHAKAQALLRAGHLTPQVLRMWQGRQIAEFEALVEGKYQRDILAAGLVWTDAELRSQWNLNDAQIALYKEFRAATDKSLGDMALSEMLRMAGDNLSPGVRERALGEDTFAGAVALLRQDIDDQVAATSANNQTQLDALNDVAAKLIETAGKVDRLTQKGYAPLMRFGDHTVYVEEAGEQVYFGLFETAAEANRMARQMRRDHPQANITQGTMAQRAYKAFAGVTPETLELFGSKLGLDQNQKEVYETYLRLAVQNRSALKRLIQRKGIAGFNDDVGRVLAGFVTSNARRTSSNLHMGEVTDSLDGIPKAEGEMRDYAQDMAEYVKNPQEEAQRLRGILFAQYLGGSVASALVNMTQPFAVSFPYLSQFGGVRKAAAQMSRAVADAIRRDTGDAALDAALKKAEEDGIVAPQEIHQLQAQAGGKGALSSGDGTLAGNSRAMASNSWARIGLAWGKLFGLAELANRRITFIAAYRTAVEQGMADPFKFAEEAVSATQFTYNKGNKPKWARGAIGSVLFTFKSYSVNYVELLVRMATQNGVEGKKAALLAVAMLVLMSGADELPFMEDAEDVVDGVAQRLLGLNWSTKQARNEWMARVMGADLARLLAKGISGIPGVPLDVSGRLGMGDLLPGTGLLLKKQDYTRDLVGVVGPVGDLAQRAFQGGGKVLQGDVTDGVAQMMPTAVRNVIKAREMNREDAYLDERKRKVIDTTPAEAMLKGIGFQPNNVARVQEASGQVQRTIALVKLREGEIADKWARGIAQDDKALVTDAREDLKAWNRRNPEARIEISMAQLRRRVKSMKQSKTERLAATAPKEIRKRVTEELKAGN